MEFEINILWPRNVMEFEINILRLGNVMEFDINIYGPEMSWNLK